MAVPKLVSGYITVPVSLKSSQAEATHIIYIRKHQGKNSSGKDDVTTVFAANLPIKTGVREIKELGSLLGNTIVQEVRFTGWNSAQIEFVDKTSCNRFLSKATKSTEVLEWPQPELSGSQKYLTQNRDKFLDQEDLKSKVNEYMEQFALLEEQKTREVRRLASMVDDDGFTTVVSSSRRSVGGIAAPKVQAELKSGKKKKSKEKTDFYRFQLREQKKEEMNKLLRQFQDDKRKVQELREKRRFRPY